METKARQLHNQALQARESGDTMSALKLADEAMMEYQKDGDKLGAAEIHADRALSMRHLYQKDGSKNWLIRAKHEAMTAVELSEASGEPTALAIPLFNMAKIQEDLGRLDEAISSYKLALTSLNDTPPPTHNRDGVRADFAIHLAVCELKKGDLSAEDRVLEGIKKLENSDEKDVSQYNFDVWLSGAYMSLADVVADKEKAKKYLSQAEAIITANPELRVRREQLARLESKP